MGSGFSRKFCPVLKIEGNFSRLRAKPAHLAGHLPPRSPSVVTIFAFDLRRLISPLYYYFRDG